MENFIYPPFEIKYLYGRVQSLYLYRKGGNSVSSSPVSSNIKNESIRIFSICEVSSQTSVANCKLYLKKDTNLALETTDRQVPVAYDLQAYDFM